MPRHILFGLIFLALISLVGMSYYYDLQKRIHELVRPGPEPAPLPGNSAGHLALSALAQGETLFPFQQARQPLGSRGTMTFAVRSCLRKKASKLLRS